MCSLCWWLSNRWLQIRLLTYSSDLVFTYLFVILFRYIIYISNLIKLKPNSWCVLLETASQSTSSQLLVCSFFSLLHANNFGLILESFLSCSRSTAPAYAIDFTFKVYIEFDTLPSSYYHGLQATFISISDYEVGFQLLSSILSFCICSQ